MLTQFTIYLGFNIHLRTWIIVAMFNSIVFAGNRSQMYQNVCVKLAVCIAFPIFVAIVHEEVFQLVLLFLCMSGSFHVKNSIFFFQNYIMLFEKVI